MKKRGMSITLLSKKSGVSYNGVFYILHGTTTNPGCYTLLSLAKALECNLSDLIDGDIKQLYQREGTDTKNYILKTHIKEIRRKKGLRGIDVAMECDISPTEFRNIENGKTKNVRIDNILKIARTLNCSVDDLVELELID